MSLFFCHAISSNEIILISKHNFFKLCNILQKIKLFNLVQYKLTLEVKSIVGLAQHYKIRDGA